MKAILFSVFAAAFLLFGCAASVQAEPEKNQSALPAADETKTPGGSTGLANPASVFCTQKGYKLEIRRGADGGEAGYCVFSGGGECEEWAYFRGTCSPKAACAAFPNCTEGTSPRFAGNGTDGCPVYECASAQARFTECTGTRPDACATLYEPVCGRGGETPSLYNYQDYSSPCVACSKSSPATGYYGGTCAGNNMTGKAKDPNVLYACPSERNAACTQESDSVCGRAVDATSTLSYFRDYLNPCEACSKASNAIAYYLGTCAGRNP